MWRATGRQDGGRRAAVYYASPILVRCWRMIASPTVREEMTRNVSAWQGECRWVDREARTVDDDRLCRFDVLHPEHQM